MSTYNLQCILWINTKNQNTAFIDNGIWNLRKSFDNGTKAANVVAPKTKVRFAIIEPTTFPIPKLMSPLTAAVVDTAISGMLVPNPTTIAPTTTAEIPSLVASSLDDSTKRSAHITSTTIPNNTKSKLINI